MLSIRGIGEVISAGLLAHLDVTKARHASGYWRFAGLDPTNDWLGEAGAKALVTDVAGPRGSVWLHDFHVMATKVNRRGDHLLHRLLAEMEAKNPEIAGSDGMWPPEHLPRKDVVALFAKRPWNTPLKRLCYLTGECFVKSSGSEQSFYGPIYQQRKAYEHAKNERGDYADQAREFAKNAKGIAAHRRAIYEGGKLSDSWIHRRAMRYTVKMFLAHVYGVMYECHYGQPAEIPWAVAHGGHENVVPIPNWPID